MPSKKKKYNARFPPARIKKIMQTDEDVGKVAAAVPVIISRALEKFIETLIVKTSETTQSKNAKTLTTSHIKQTIHGEKKFDFLRDLVASVPDHQTEEDAEGSCVTTDSKRLKTPRQRKQRNSGKKRKKKGGSDSSEDGGNVNEEEEEEEEEDDSETETDEEDKTQATPLSDTSSHMASPNQSSGNYPAHSSKASCDNLPSGSHSSQSTNLMGPPIGYNMSGNSQMPHSAFPCATPSGTVPFPLPGMLHPQGMRGPFPMQYDNHMSQQSQPLNLCSTGSSYNLGMFPPSGYPSPYPPINTAPAAFHNHPGPSGQPPNLSHNTEGTKMYMQHKDTSYKDSEKLKIANNNSHTNTVSEPAALNLSMAVKTSINTSTEDDDYDT